MSVIEYVNDLCRLYQLSPQSPLQIPHYFLSQATIIDVLFQLHGRLPQLTSLSLACQDLTSIPRVLLRFSALQYLDLRDNCLTAEAVADCFNFSQIQQLNLLYNPGISCNITRSSLPSRILAYNLHIQDTCLDEAHLFELFVVSDVCPCCASFSFA